MTKFKVGDTVRAIKYIENAYCSLRPYDTATIMSVFDCKSGSQIVDVQFTTQQGEKCIMSDIVCLPENMPLELEDEK